MVSVSLVYFVNYINANFGIISLKLLFLYYFVFIWNQPIRVDILASRRFTFRCIFFALDYIFPFFLLVNISILIGGVRMDKLSNMIDKFLLTRTWYVIQWLFIITVAFDLIFYSYGFWTKLFYLAGLAAGFSNIKEWHKKHIYSVKRKH